MSEETTICDRCGSEIPVAEANDGPPPDWDGACLCNDCYAIEAGKEGQQPVAWIDRHQHPWNKDLGWVSDLRWTRDECEGEATPLYRAALAAAPLERIARFLTSQEVKAVYRTIDVIYDEELQRMFAEVNGITLAQKGENAQ